jgi:hypothetical protein
MHSKVTGQNHKQGTPEELSYLRAETDLYSGSSEECKANKSQFGLESSPPFATRDSADYYSVRYSRMPLLKGT